MRCSLAALNAKFSRSNSSLVFFTFWPATANCSANPVIAASESFNFERATSYSRFIPLARSWSATRSNLIRSQSAETLFTSTSQFEVRIEIFSIRSAFSDAATKSVISLKAVNLPKEPALSFSVDCNFSVNTCNSPSAAFKSIFNLLNKLSRPGSEAVSDEIWVSINAKPSR